MLEAVEVLEFVFLLLIVSVIPLIFSFLVLIFVLLTILSQHSIQKRNDDKINIVAGDIDLTFKFEVCQLFFERNDKPGIYLSSPKNLSPKSTSFHFKGK